MMEQSQQNGQGADQRQTGAPAGGSGEAPRKAGPAQVIGCWVILLVVVGVVVFTVYKVGRAFSPFQKAQERSESVPDKNAIGKGDLEAGKTYVGSIALELSGIAFETPATQEAPQSQPADTGQAAAPTQDDENAEAVQDEENGDEDLAIPQQRLVGDDEKAVVVSGTATNAGDKTVTYLKVHVVLADEQGEALGESWVDAATALGSAAYARHSGDMPPEKTVEFQARVIIPKESEPDQDKSTLEVTACAVK